MERGFSGEVRHQIPEMSNCISGQAIGNPYQIAPLVGTRSSASELLLLDVGLPQLNSQIS